MCGRSRPDHQQKGEPDVDNEARYQQRVILPSPAESSA
jgi:hypothetical protein